MANGNGMMVKALLMILILVGGGMGTLVMVGASNLSDGISHNDAKIDTVEAKQVAYDKQQARVAITLDQIASALKVPSAIDTAAALRVLNGDSL